MDSSSRVGKFNAASTSAFETTYPPYTTPWHTHVSNLNLLVNLVPWPHICLCVLDAPILANGHGFPAYYHPYGYLHTVTIRVVYYPSSSLCGRPTRPIACVEGICKRGPVQSLNNPAFIVAKFLLTRCRSAYLRLDSVNRYQIILAIAQGFCLVN